MKHVCIVYSQEDREIKDQLEAQLRDIDHEVCCDTWEDSHIQPGSRWFSGFRHSIEKAHVVVLIFSSYFLKSPFISEKKFARILERSQNKGVVVLSFYAKLCLWERIAWLNTLPVFPIGRKSLVEMDEPLQSGILREFAEYVFDFFDIEEQDSSNTPV